MQKLLPLIGLNLTIFNFCYSQNFDRTDYSRKEFSDIKNELHKYVPLDIVGDTIIFQQYEDQEVLELYKLALVKSFKDTSELNERNVSLLMGQQAVSVNWQVYQKIRRLGFKVSTLSKEDIEKCPKEKCRYIVKISFYTDRKSMNHNSWMNTIDFYVYDRLNDYFYDTLRDKKRDLSDLFKMLPAK